MMMETILIFVSGMITTGGIVIALTSHQDYKRDKKFRELHDMVRNLGSNLLL